jgi:hypothetical protein
VRRGRARERVSGVAASWTAGLPSLGGVGAGGGEDDGGQVTTIKKTELLLLLLLLLRAPMSTRSSAPKIRDFEESILVMTIASLMMKNDSLAS